MGAPEPLHGPPTMLPADGPDPGGPWVVRVVTRALVEEEKALFDVEANARAYLDWLLRPPTRFVSGSVRAWGTRAQG